MPMTTRQIDLKPGENVLSLPATAQLLNVAGIREHVRLWVAVDFSVAPTEFKILVVHTGANVPSGASYVGTALLANGELHVWRIE